MFKLRGTLVEQSGLLGVGIVLEEGGIEQGCVPFGTKYTFHEDSIGSCNPHDSSLVSDANNDVFLVHYIDGGCGSHAVERECGMTTVSRLVAVYPERVLNFA